MTVAHLADGPEDASAMILLAHGAGAPMDSASLEMAAKALAGQGLRVMRFEFGYMAARREGHRRPPPRAETLLDEFEAAVDELGRSSRLVIGGKSMGGRVASMVADGMFQAGKIQGLLCLGYPFHPPGKPHQLRTAHLAEMRTPALIVQGTRDPFGTRDEVSTYPLASPIDILWLEDGDHDLKPRKSISGFSQSDHMTRMAREVAAWVRMLD